MTPLATLTKYNLGMLDVMDDEKKLMNFLRMEKWLADRPHHPGEAAKQWLKDLYQENKLVKNQFELSGRKVELPNITMPVLNIYARERPHHPAADARARWATASAPTTTPRSACPAATSACSSAASRRAFSARASRTGCRHAIT